MIDIHPPHAAAHSWRDIFIHLATITIGLFIALSLEAAIEGMHHRHIVKEARENIRREIEQNVERAKKDEVSVQTNADNMKLNIQKARNLRDHPHALGHNEMHFSFTWDSFNDSAWRAAHDSGALTLMPAAEVQSYADVYGQQEIVNHAAVTIFTSETDGVAPLFMEDDARPLLPDEVQELLHSSSVSLIRLTTLKQIIEGLERDYADTLKK